MNIAVSGNKGSFSHQAAELYATGHQLSDYEIIYGIDSAGAMAATADKVIVPIYNNTGGLVNMTLKAMGEHLFEIEEIFEMNISQCIMGVKNVDPEIADTIASHPQALKQCKEYLKEHWPKRQLLEYQDTAEAAKDVAEGKLPPTTLAIAPRLAAEIYGLELLAESIQDLQFNATTFLVLNVKDNQCTGGGV